MANTQNKRYQQVPTRTESINNDGLSGSMLEPEEEEPSLLQAQEPEDRTVELNHNHLPPRVSVESPTAAAHTSDPRLWSITYQQLLDIETLAKQNVGYWEFRQLSMRDIANAIIAPKCRETGTSYALALNPEGLPMDAFITHSWDEPFFEFVDSIRNAFRPFTCKPNIWVCAFAMLQGDQAYTEEQLDVPLRDSPFVKALKQASWFVVVRNSKTDLFGRIWCVCELMFARKFGFTTTHKTMVIGPNNFSHLRTSCLHAEATNPCDKQRILSALQLEHEDLEEIDKLLLGYRMHHGSDVNSNSPCLSLRRLFFMAWCIVFVLIGYFALLSEPSAEYYLSKSDNQLWNIATHPKQFIGKYCYILISKDNTTMCRYYAKGRPLKYDGLPMTKDGDGTGCVKDVADPFCYYNDPAYNLTQKERNSMCTASHVANGAAQIRYGIRHQRCNDIGDPL